MSQFPESPSIPAPPPFAYLLNAGTSNSALDGLAVPPAPNSASDVVVVDQPHPDLVTGYLVSVIHIWTQPAAPSRGRPSAPKKAQVVKSDRMQLDTMSRYELAMACLSLHNLEDEYRASKVFGFSFKMWWTGSSGGKSAAATIETDAEYELLRAQLLASKRNAKDITVFVSFDTDEMDAFRRLPKRTVAINPIESAVGLGTKVPRLANMDTVSQLHGDIILKLKDTHPCEKHRGEHGEPGYCYIAPDGSHVGLNNRRFAIWAAAMAAGDATRFVPPNVAEFDGPQGLGTAVSKPRGRGPAQRAPSTATTPSTSSDATAMLMAAMVPLLVSLTRSVGPPAGPAPPVSPPSIAVNIPDVATDANALEPGEPGIASGFLFLPSHTLDCLLAFKDETGINILEKAAALDHRDLTPDIIPEVPHDHLAGVLGVSEGKTLKFQLFCRRWAREFSRKQKEKEVE